MKKLMILSAFALAVVMMSSSCKKKEEEEVTADENKAPTVSVEAQFVVTLTKAARTSAPASYDIAITATASDQDGSIAKVEFYLNGSKVSQDTSSPYEASTTTFQVENTIYAIAYDNDGKSTQSESISLNVAP